MYRRRSSSGMRRKISKPDTESASRLRLFPTEGNRRNYLGGILLKHKRFRETTEPWNKTVISTSSDNLIRRHSTLFDYYFWCSYLQRMCWPMFITLVMANLVNTFTQLWTILNAVLKEFLPTLLWFIHPFCLSNGSFQSLPVTETFCFDSNLPIKPHFRFISKFDRRLFFSEANMLDFVITYWFTLVANH